jgi:hypothetical protein
VLLLNHFIEGVAVISAVTAIDAFAAIFLLLVFNYFYFSAVAAGAAIDH